MSTQTNIATDEPSVPPGGATRDEKPGRPIRPSPSPLPGGEGFSDEGYNVLCSLHSGYAPHTADAQVGQPAPDFTLEDTGGNRHTLSSFRGRAHVVLVFGSIT